MLNKVAIESVQDQWKIHVHTVEVAVYQTLEITDIVYPNWIISHVLSGEVTTGSSGDEHVVQAGEVMIHPPFLPFFERSTGPGVHQWISIGFIDMYNVDFFRVYPVGPVIRLTDPVRYSGIFQELLDRWHHSRGIFRNLSITTHVLHLLLILMESIEGQRRPVRSSSFMTNQDRFFPLIWYMAENLNKKITREMLADQVRLSPNYMDKAFHQAYGVLPMQMLRDMRLSKAKRMLETSEETLSVIASACGMYDAPYLSRQFCKAYGMTPQKFKVYIQMANSTYMTT